MAFKGAVVAGQWSRVIDRRVARPGGPGRCVAWDVEPEMISIGVKIKTADWVESAGDAKLVVSRRSRVGDDGTWASARQIINDPPEM